MRRAKAQESVISGEIDTFALSPILLTDWKSDDAFDTSPFEERRDLLVGIAYKALKGIKTPDLSKRFLHENLSIVLEDYTTKEILQPYFGAVWYDLVKRVGMSEAQIHEFLTEKYDGAVQILLREAAASLVSKPKSRLQARRASIRVRQIIPAIYKGRDLLRFFIWNNAALLEIGRSHPRGAELLKRTSSESTKITYLLMGNVGDDLSGGDSAARTILRELGWRFSQGYEYDYSGDGGAQDAAAKHWLWNLCCLWSWVTGLVRISSEGPSWYPPIGPYEAISEFSGDDYRQFFFPKTHVDAALIWFVQEKIRPSEASVAMIWR